MTDQTSPAPAAPIPWYQSKVQVSLVVSTISIIAVAFPGLAAALGWIDADHIQRWVESVFGALGFLVPVVVNIVGMIHRAKSPLQPLTIGKPESPASTSSLLIALSLLGLMALGACGTLVPTGLETFNEKLDAAYQADAGVYRIVDTLYQAHVITKDDSLNVSNQADNITAALDIAKEVHSTDAAGAQSKLDATVKALKALTDYLSQKQPGGKTS